MNVNVNPQTAPSPTPRQPMEWPEGALTRVPFWIYQSPDIYALEQQRLFEGPVWNYLCLEAEVAKPGDYRTTFVGSHAGRGGARLRRRNLRLREPLRAPRRADRARQRRARARLHLRLSRLELRPERQPQGGRVRGRRRRQGRHGQDLLPLRPRAAQAADRDLRGPGVRQPVRRRAADRGISRRGDRRQDHARAAQAGGGDRPLHADAAEQLEALFRERQGHLPRQPAAHVLHHLPHQPAVAARRPGDQPERRQPRELLVRRQPVERARLFGDGTALGDRGLCAQRPEPARHRRRVRRRLPPANPDRVPELRAAADPERAGDPADPAEGPEPDRAELDLPSALPTTRRR